MTETTEATVAEQFGVANAVTVESLGDAVLRNSRRPKTTAPLPEKKTTTRRSAKKSEVVPAPQPAPVVTPKAAAKAAEGAIDPAKQKEFDAVVKLLKAGKKWAEISTTVGISYGRAKTLGWFWEFVGAAPETRGYTAEKRAEGQKKYETGVAERKAAKRAAEDAAAKAAADAAKKAAKAATTTKKGK